MMTTPTTLTTPRQRKSAGRRPADVLTELRRPFAASELRLQVAQAVRSGLFPVQASIDPSTVVRRLDAVDPSWSMSTQVSPILGGCVDCHLTVGGITRTGAVTVNKFHPGRDVDPLNFAYDHALVAAAARFAVGAYLSDLPAFNAVVVRAGGHAVIPASEVSRVRTEIRSWHRAQGASLPAGDDEAAVALTTAGEDASQVLSADAGLAEVVQATEELLRQMEATSSLTELLGLAPLIQGHPDVVKDAVRQRFGAVQARFGTPVPVVAPRPTVVPAPAQAPPAFTLPNGVNAAARELSQKIKECETIEELTEIEAVIEKAPERVTLGSLLIGALEGRRHLLENSSQAA
jgi:hypothetical protein